MSGTTRSRRAIRRLSPWYGSKVSLAPRIAAELGPHTRYYEPYCGSMSVLLTKPPAAVEVVNDLSGDMINLARVIRSETLGPALYRRLRRTIYSEEAREQAVRALMAEPPADTSPDDDSSEAAGVFLDRAYHYFIACWMGRSGDAGVKGEGSFAVSYGNCGGAMASQFAGAVDSLAAWRRRMRSVTITRRDAVQMVTKIADDPGAAIYCDPPYLAKSREYDIDMTAEQHGELAETLDWFMDARIVVSYYDHPRLDELYRPDRWTKIPCGRVKNLSNASGASPSMAPEVLLVNGPAITYQKGAA